jgi:hypothetical protein
MVSVTPWGSEVPSAPSIRLAMDGSPMKPMPSEVSVIPSWQADRYSGRSAICLRASFAPPLPSSTRTCI